MNMGTHGAIMHYVECINKLYKIYVVGRVFLLPEGEEIVCVAFLLLRKSYYSCNYACGAVLRG